MQVYAWQMSGYFLTLSALFMLLGMLIMVWSSTGYAPGENWRGWWNGEAKMAVTFTVVSGIAVILFIIQQWTLYSWHGRDDADQADHGREGHGDSPSRALGPVGGQSPGESTLLPSLKNRKYGTSS